MLPRIVGKSKMFKNNGFLSFIHVYKNCKHRLEAKFYLCLSLRENYCITLVSRINIAVCTLKALGKISKNTSESVHSHSLCTINKYIRIE